MYHTNYLLNLFKVFISNQSWKLCFLFRILFRNLLKWCYCYYIGCINYGKRKQFWNGKSFIDTYNSNGCITGILYRNIKTSLILFTFLCYLSRVWRMGCLTLNDPKTRFYILWYWTINNNFLPGRFINLISFLL